MADVPGTTERERDEAAELELLESLWVASPDEPARKPLVRRALAWLGERLGWVLAFAWLGFIVSLFAAPAGNPNAVVPLWAEIVIAGFFLALGTTGVLAAVRAGSTAYAASIVAGALGIALAAACGSTEHHAAGWWGYELGATIALTGLSVAGLTQRRRR
jgi:hypothetical protein